MNNTTEYKVGDHVKFVQDGKTVKRGRITELTSAGARVFYRGRRADDPDNDTYPEYAEWFAFSNKHGGLVKYTPVK